MSVSTDWSNASHTWLPPGDFGGVQLPIGYFANVVNIGAGQGLAICTDGVGSKAIIAQLMNGYDTIGIDCIAMNVNDLICVGAQPVSFVDCIALEHVDAQILDSIAIGLADGAEQAGISISGGETAQLEDVVRGFDLAGTAVGMVPLDKIVTAAAKLGPKSEYRSRTIDSARVRTSSGSRWLLGLPRRLESKLVAPSCLRLRSRRNSSTAPPPTNS